MDFTCCKQGLLSSFRLLVAEASWGGAQALGCVDSVAVVPRFSCSVACGIFLGQRLHLCPPALADWFLTTGPPGNWGKSRMASGRWPATVWQRVSEPFCVFRCPFPDPTPQGLCQAHHRHDSQKHYRVRMTQYQSQSGGKTFWVLFGDSHNSFPCGMT